MITSKKCSISVALIPMILCLVGCKGDSQPSAPDHRNCEMPTFTKLGFVVAAMADALNEQLLSQYRAAAFNTLVINREYASGEENSSPKDETQYVPTIRMCEQGCLPYFFKPPTPNNGAIEQRFKWLASKVDTFSQNMGILINDEAPKTESEMVPMRDLMDMIRTYGRDEIFSIWRGKPLIVGLLGEGSFTANYGEYVRKVVNFVNPDILIYNDYPFELNGGTKLFYRQMVTIRQNAGTRPCWVYLQAYDRKILPNENVRMPSESDIRVHAYAHVTAGYRGFVYWKLNYGLVFDGDQLGQGYDYVSKLNRELGILGLTMQKLTNFETRAISGGAADFSNQTGIPEFSPNSKWAGIETAWVETTGGLDKNKQNGMIGFFSDVSRPQSDQNLYFMLVNLNHGMGRSAESTKLMFHMRFKGVISHPDDQQRGITELLYLDTKNGSTQHARLQRVADNTYQLNVELPGGTGILYKFDNGDFPR